MYQNKAERRDLVDDGDDDILTSDQGNQQAGFVYKSYNKRSTKQQQTQQKQANPQIAPKIEGLVNGETRQWGLVNLNELLLFPLKSSSEVANPAKPKLAAVMPRSASFFLIQALCPSRRALVKLHTMSLLHPQPFRL